MLSILVAKKPRQIKIRPANGVSQLMASSFSEQNFFNEAIEQDQDQSGECTFDWQLRQIQQLILVLFNFLTRFTILPLEVKKSFEVPTIQKSLDLYMPPQIERLQSIDLIYNFKEQFQIEVILSQRRQSLFCKQSNYQSLNQKRQGDVPNLASFFQAINSTLRSESIIQLKQCCNSQFLTLIKTIFNNWEIYMKQLRDELLLFARILQVKRYKFNNIFQVLFPQIKGILSSLLNRLQQTTIGQKIQQLVKQKIIRQYSNQIFKQAQKQLQDQLQIKKENLADLLLSKFEESQNKILDEKKEYIVKNKKDDKRTPLKNYIAKQMPGYHRDIKWKNVFDKISAAANAEDVSKQFQIVRKKKADYFCNIENYQTIDTHCLGCSKFFIKGFDILSDFFMQPPIIVHSSINQANQMREELLNGLCALINQGGGLILYGCQAENRNVISHGELIRQDQKEQIIAYLHSLSSLFYPKLEFNRQITVSFVPVCQNPFNITMGKATLGEINFVQGHYITRILIKPVFAQYTYSWINNDNHIFSSLIQGKAKQLSFRNVLKTIKKKFHSNYIPSQNLNAEEKLLMSKPSSYFDHECGLPQKGMSIIKVQRQREQIVNDQIQNQFASLSLMICKHSHLSHIQQLLLKNNIQCYIQTDRFEKYRFKSAKYTALMYSNLKPEEILLKIVLNKDFQLNKKQLLVLMVTDYLKLENRTQRTYFNKQQFWKLQKWLQSQFPSEKLRVWSFLTEEEKIEIYISTQSKLSRMFLYQYRQNPNFQREQSKKYILSEKQAQKLFFAYRFIAPILNNEHKDCLQIQPQTIQQNKEKCKYAKYLNAKNVYNLI